MDTWLERLTLVRTGSGPSGRWVGGNHLENPGNIAGRLRRWAALAIKKTDIRTYQQREPSPIHLVRHFSDVASTSVYSHAYSFLMIAWSALDSHGTGRIIEKRFPHIVFGFTNQPDPENVHNIDNTRWGAEQIPGPKWQRALCCMQSHPERPSPLP